MADERVYCEKEERFLRPEERVPLDDGWLHIAPKKDTDTVTDLGHMTCYAGFAAPDGRARGNVLLAHQSAQLLSSADDSASPR
ncbi:hypothetical protein [Agromyces sp. LHK192]|uniref:hypothetical protein n=1 Tax=Agromyces sp. LHK192 TaxID=2498704 RepID=UPI000FDC1513|nr:hypothetical protein [Agromyces sp. LHK192]